jgi:TRAP-type mannitol/chloroaromatic compound transport system permease small subunit
MTGQRGELGQPLPSDMPRWMALAIDGIDVVNHWIGRIVCWLTVPLFSAMAFEIFVRYAFIAPTMWAYDISRMLCGALFMLGAGYALSRGVHIRADFLYRQWSERAQGIVDLVLYLLLYFPGLIIFLHMSIEFAATAWIRGERGMDTAWMPQLAPVKTVLPVGIALLLLQGVSETLKSYYAATRGRWPR